MKNNLKYYGVLVSTLAVSVNAFAGVLPNKPAAKAPSVSTPVGVKPEVKVNRNISLNYGASYHGNEVGQIKCLGANRGSDSVTSNLTGELKTTAISCASVLIDGASAKNVKLTFIEDKKSKPVASPNGSPDCVGTFKNWQSNPKQSAFIATWEAGRLVCKNIESAIPTFVQGLQFKPSGILGALGKLQVGGLINPRSLYEIKIDGVTSRWTGPVIWAKRGLELGETQQFVFFSDGPRKEKQAFIQVFKGTKSSNGNFLAPNAPKDCNNWKNAQGSIFTYPIDISVAKANNENKLDFASEIKGLFDPHWIYGKMQKPLFAAIQAKAGGDQIVYARFVLVQPGTEKCAERPTSFLKIDYGIDPMTQFNNDVKDVNQKIAAFNEQAKKKYEDAKAAAKPTPPASVSIASFIPRHHDAAVMQAIPAYFATIKGADGKMGAWVPNWQVADDIPWPKGQRNWHDGCHFTTGALEQAILLGKSGKPTGWLDAIITGLSLYATAWSAMKDVFVSAFVNLSTFGACPANFPGQPQEKMPKSCSYLKTASKTGLNIAMSSVGIPPEIPSAKSLIEGGAEYLATQAVDYGLKQVAGSGASEYLSTATEFVGQQAIDELTDYARKKMISEVKDQLVNMTEAGSCPYPAASYQEAKEKGYTAWNPNNQCGSKTTGMADSLASMGKVAPTPAGDINNAVLWLNLKPTAGKARGKVVTITVSTPDFTFPQNYPTALFNAIKSYGVNGQLRLFKPVTLTIDSADIPTEGLKIPINLTLNQDDWNVWKSMVQKAQICALNAFYESCVEENAIGNRNFLLSSPQNLSINVSYRWTDDESILKQCADFKNVIGGQVYCTTFDSKIEYQALNIKQNLSKTWGGNYGIPNYANVCPGFAPTTDPQTGLPRLKYTWGPDDLK